MHTRHIAAGILSLACWAARAGAQDIDPNQPLQVRDILSIREFADRVQLDLSPDSRFVAYALRDPLRAASRERGSGSRYFTFGGVPRAQVGTDIHVTEILTSATQNITRSVRSSNWNPVWSPDGRTLAFFSDRDGIARVWLWNRSTRQFRRLTSEPARSFFGFESIRWSPNGRRVAVKLSPLNLTRGQLDRLLPAGPATRVSRRPADAATATVFSVEAAGDSAGVPADSSTARVDTLRSASAVGLDSTRSFLNVELADLAMIDVVTGRVRRLARRARVMGWHWSPDARFIAYTTRQPDDGTGVLVYDHFDLHVVDTAGGPPRRLVSRMIQEYGLAFSWSPNGQLIAYVSDRRIHVASAKGGEPRQLTGNEREFDAAYRAPLWMSDDAVVAISSDTLFRIDVSSGHMTAVAAPEGRHVLDVVASADAQRSGRQRVTMTVHDPVTSLSGFRTVDFANGTFAGRLDDQFAFGGDGPYHLDASADGQTIAFVAERGDRPAEVWVTQEVLTHANRITNLNPQVTRVALGASRLLQWTGPGGELLQGALLMPGNYEPGKRFPLVVKVQGGAGAASRINRFGFDRGVDNLHLLATRGYGVLLPDAPLRTGSPLEDLAATVMPGVDSAIALGLADPDRLAVMGHGYGGYAVLALLVQTNRFRAAVSSGGFSNLFSQYVAMREDGNAGGPGSEQSGMGGDPWRMRQGYIQNSPFFFLDSITTPVLLLHGGEDRTVLPERAEETFVALRGLGKIAELVRYEGEDHDPRAWTVANAMDYWTRIFTWIERYLERP